MGGSGTVDPEGSGGDDLSYMDEMPPSRAMQPASLPVMPGEETDVYGLTMPEAGAGPEVWQRRQMLHQALGGIASRQAAAGQPMLPMVRRGPRPTATVTQEDTRAPTMKMPAATVTGDSRARQIEQRPGLQHALARQFAQALGFNVEDVADDGAVTRAFQRLQRNGITISHLLNPKRSQQLTTMFSRLLQEEAAKSPPSQGATRPPIPPS